MRRALRLLVPLLGVAAGCAKLVGADFDDPTLAPQPSADAAASDASGCALPTSGDAHVRFGVFVPTLDRFDVCVDGAPILARGGASCPAGVGYEEVLAPFALASGSHTIAAARAGDGCDPVATASIAIDAGGTTSLYLLSDPAAPQLVAFPETTSASSDPRVRFVHALLGSGQLDFGFAGGASLPTTLTPIFSHVAFATTAPPGTSSVGAIDANGYVTIPAPRATGTVAASPSGAIMATLLTTPSFEAKHRYTIVATGSSTDVRFPEELYACDEAATDGVLTACGGAGADMTIDDFDPVLGGPLSPALAARRSAVLDAIGKLKSDVVCLEGLPLDDDKLAIVEAAFSQYLFHVSYHDDLSTAVDDPRDQNGTVPPPDNSAACTAAMAPAVDPVLSCLEASCSTKPNDASGSMVENGLQCFYDQCAKSAATLIGQYHDCWMCTLTQLASARSFEETRQNCMTAPSPRIPFDGASDLLVLTRNTPTAIAQYVLPATYNRSSIVRVSLNVQTVPVDVYCVHAEGAGDALLFPYTGPYGNGMTGNAGWREEMKLQMKQVIAYVNATSAATRRRAIVVGHFGSGPSAAGVLDDQAPEVYAILAGAFPLAVPRDYAPSCTSCADNPLYAPLAAMGPVPNTWTELAMLSGIPVTDVRSASVTFQEAVVDTDAGKVPLSNLYGFRSTVHIRP